MMTVVMLISAMHVTLAVVATDVHAENIIFDSINNSLPTDPAYSNDLETSKYRMEAECADIHYVNNKISEAEKRRVTEL